MVDPIMVGEFMRKGTVFLEKKNEIELIFDSIKNKIPNLPAA